MSKNVDISNLQKSLELLEHKFKDLAEKRILLTGIVIGILIALPLQILVVPLKFEEGNGLFYGSNLVIGGISSLAYFLIFLALSLIILFLSFKYTKRKLVGIKEEEIISLTYSTEKSKILSELRNLLDVESKFFDVICKTPDGKSIECYKLEEIENIFGGKSKEENKVLDITFPEEKIIKLIYYPEIEMSRILVKKIIEEYKV